MLSRTSLLALLPAVALASPLHNLPRQAAPVYSGVKISANRDGRCLTVFSRYGFNDGAEVRSEDCSVATTWDISPGSGSVIVHGHPQFALDAGENPNNGGRLKIWTSYPGLYQQTWYLTEDKRIAITGGTQCLDQSETSTPQTWECTTGNTNQIWNIVGDSGTPPPSDGQRIRARYDGGLCVTYMMDAERTVQMARCFSDEAPWSSSGLWELPSSGTGLVKLRSPAEVVEQCLTATSAGSNGAQMHIEACEQGKASQTWTWANGELRLASGQCLDIERDSEGIPAGPGKRPFGSEKNLQTWQCGGGNIQQQFYV